MLNVEEVLNNLVKFNTIKDKDNKEIINYIEKTLKQFGFSTEKKEKFLIMSNKKESGIGFLGHTDTVEYTEGWNYEKFKTTTVGKNIYGLGVCDMKSGIAAIITAISELNLKDYNKGIKLYFTYDEEIGFSGIKDVVNYEKNFPKMMIIGEPTNNQIILGSKGLMEYKISFKGIKAHSSTPDKGKSAIISAINFINELEKFYKEEIKEDIDLRFEIPYTTMNIGKIEGGSAINSVPDYCEFLVDFRTTNEFAEEKIISKLRMIKDKYDAQIEEINKLSPFINNEIKDGKTSNFITEASFINVNRIILGAGPVTAHEVDEYITKDSLYLLVKQYKELIEKNI